MALFIGFSFPFRKGETSFPAVATDNDLIKQALIQLVLTGTGERIMRPEFGSAAFAYVFENNDDMLQQRLETELTQIIHKYEPRVALLGVAVERGDPRLESEATSVIVTISYIVLATRKTDEAQITLSTGSGG